ncbi:hypothetical protein [Pseudomonas aeruginosa]|uniref:hypothetical protein n=1 Tax=Pseudomonas aeruginosa TaxID=287 RepID=UPI00071BBD2A|nr:hypothetical protein [Pseudomonas aeruginosa]KSR46051.1 hypothetical protein APB45_14725 [Pseudomonas aeruginosa]RPV01984.1 hypothetical protein IPC878_24040 [Pseudomonas aeruginosa]
MRQEHRPHGKAPTAWEADILKLRAFEMVLILFYMEDLRRFIIGSIETTDTFNGMSRLSDGKPKTKEGKKLDLARAVLLSEGVIDQAESDELKELIDYRNTIGHTVHDLTVDVGAYSHLTKQDAKTFEPIPDYDYTAAKRAKRLRQKVMNGMSDKFMMRASFDFLAFEAAERTYVAEIERLKKRVNKGIEKANRVIAETRRVIQAIPKSVMESAQPGHPRNIKENGTLSARGADCIFELYEARATPLAAAYLMRVSHRSATHWLTKWKASKA